MMSASHPRQRGVTVNEPRQYGDPKTVGALVKLDTYGIQYRDADGLLHRSVVMIGEDGSVYLPKNGEEWSAQLSLAAGWLKEGVEKILQARGAAAAAPVEALPLDTVDVMSTPDAQGPADEKADASPGK